jgi:3-methyladenine DNA glycosylase AlkD
MNVEAGYSMKSVAGKAAAKPEKPTAKAFQARLMALQSNDELKKIQRYFKSGEGDYGEGDRFIGVRMGSLFKLAEEFLDMPIKEIERLLESDIHEMRAGACSIMGKAAAKKGASDERRHELFELYLRRHDRINNWDLVDLAAWHVIGPWLVDKPRDILYRLAKSKSIWERRTAILATFAFIKRGQFEDTLKISELLLKAPEDLIHKAAGGMLRAVGDKHPDEHRAFLDKHVTVMPRVMLRYAIEKLPPRDREHYLGLGKKQIGTT